MRLDVKRLKQLAGEDKGLLKALPERSTSAGGYYAGALLVIAG
ncbi:hypothetical protein GPROT1_03510 [Gammaproteobacteria bacterium]|nr:hypothetical protein GPROT1_03510 [Gammaproteobacteria bacterium]